jgi:hypothetical protein
LARIWHDHAAPLVLPAPGSSTGQVGRAARVVVPPWLWITSLNLSLLLGTCDQCSSSLTFAGLRRRPPARRMRAGCGMPRLTRHACAFTVCPGRGCRLRLWSVLVISGLRQRVALVKETAQRGDGVMPALFEDADQVSSGQDDDRMAVFADLLIGLRVYVGCRDQTAPSSSFAKSSRRPSALAAMASGPSVP